MADCCAEKKRDEMRQFVRQKAKNFIELMRPFCKTPEQNEFILKYDETQVEEVVKTYLFPLYSTNTLSFAKDTIASQLNITDTAILEKVERYLQCFCECILD